MSMDSNTANDLAHARSDELSQIQECLVDPDERRPGRAYQRVQELLLEVKDLRARVPGERLQTAIDAFREYEEAGWTMVALPPDVASQIIGLPANQQNAFAFMGNLKAKIALLEMSSETTGWRVVDSASESWVLLAHPDYDGPTGHRLAVPVSFVEGSDVPEDPIVHPVYPCRRCGWEHACEDEGGCHS